MTVYIANDFSEIVFGCKSAQVYGGTHKIPHEEMLVVIQEATATPSSVNIQPWHLTVVGGEVGREKLKPLIRFNTRQSGTPSTMLLILGGLNCHEQGGEIYNRAYASSKMPKEVQDQQLTIIVPHHGSLSKEQVSDVVKIDTGLAAMQFMLIARTHEYETDPIGGFEVERLTGTFSLDQERYIPAVILSVGKGIETGYRSVRLAPEKITTFRQTIKNDDIHLH